MLSQLLTGFMAYRANDLIREDMITISSAKETIEYLLAEIADYPSSVFFRGENKLHPSLLPSFYRLPEEDRRQQSGRYIAMTLSLLETVIYRHIMVSYGVPLYKDGEYFGGNDLISKYQGGSTREVVWQVQALLQHYGYPTDWLDITFSPRAAVFLHR